MNSWAWKQYKSEQFSKNYSYSSKLVFDWSSLSCRNRLEVALDGSDKSSELCVLKMSYLFDKRVDSPFSVFCHSKWTCVTAYELALKSQSESGIVFAYLDYTECSVICRVLTSTPALIPLWVLHCFHSSVKSTNFDWTVTYLCFLCPAIKLPASGFADIPVSVWSDQTPPWTHPPQTPSQNWYKHSLHPPVSELNTMELPSTPSMPNLVSSTYSSAMVNTTPYSGLAEDCSGLLLQCSFALEMQPHCFLTNRAGIT